MKPKSPGKVKAGEIPLTYQHLALPLREMSEGLREAWRNIQKRNPAISSPYFTPEFTLAAARAREDTELVVARRGELVVAIFPFHRLPGDRAIPVGGAINDYHGVIAEAVSDFDFESILKVAGLKGFEFHSWHWPAAAVSLWCFSNEIEETSAAIGVGSGDYLQQLKISSITIRRQGQKTRKLIREVGPLKFVLHDSSPETLDWVIEQKRAKYSRTGCTDFFAPRWSRRLLHELHQKKSHSFSSLLSVLYAGDQRVAAHFGIKTPNVLHYWYPVFNPVFGRYSPGTELYLYIVGAMQKAGVQRIDFGYGTEDFKLRIANGFGQLSSGEYGCSRLRFGLKKTMWQAHQRIRRSALRVVVRDAVRMVWPSAGKPVVK